MPKFTIRVRVTNYSGVPVKVHIGASLIGQKDLMEYYNTSDDIRYHKGSWHGKK